MYANPCAIARNEYRDYTKAKIMSKPLNVFFNLFCKTAETALLNPQERILSLFMDSVVTGQILALVTALCWALNSATYSVLGKTVKSSSLAHARSLFAVPFVFILMVFTEGFSFLNISSRSFTALMLSGVTGYYITDVLMFYAYVALGPREALVIMTFSPVVSSILSGLCFGEVLSAGQWISILLIITGITLMVLDEILSSTEVRSRNRAVKGMSAAFAGALFQAVSYILARYALDDVGPVSTNFLRNLAGLLCFIVISFLPKSTFRKDAVFLKDRKMLVQLLFACITGPVLGMSFQMMALRLAPVGIVSALSQISPLYMLPIDILFLKKKVHIVSVAGTVISIVGAVMLFI